MKILWVFPHQNSFVPSDAMTTVGPPQLWLPEVDEVHISCVFSWDVDYCQYLQQAWQQYYPKVRLGGPAFGLNGDQFVRGLYVKPGITFTSRGCNNHCPWCIVPIRERGLRTLPITPGYIVQDNNLLQCPRDHLEGVFEMLRRQRKGAILSGGLQADLLDDWVAQELRTVSIKALFLAADTDEALRPLQEAIKRLSWLRHDQIRCYVLMGWHQTPREAEKRLKKVWDMGAEPFAQLYQPIDTLRRVRYSQDWLDLSRIWARPALTRRAMAPSNATPGPTLFEEV